MKSNELQSSEPPSLSASPAQVLQFPPPKNPDDYVREGVEWLRGFAKRFNDKLGAFIKSKALMLGRMTYHIIKNASIIFVGTILPLFAWWSLGVLLLWSGSIGLFGIGIVIFLVPIFVLWAQAYEEFAGNWKQLPGVLYDMFASASRTPIDLHVAERVSWRSLPYLLSGQAWQAVADKLKYAASSTMAALYRFFTGSETASAYYYVFWIGGAVFITASMFLTTVGSALADTWFGNANIVLVHAIFVKMPTLIVGIVFDIWNGVNVEPNSELLRRLFRG
jgi:hypothetical protein